MPPAERRFKPGQSGNPSGHAKGYYSISQAQKDFLSWPFEIVRLILEDGIDSERIPKIYRRRMKSAHDLVRARWIAGRSPEMPWGNAAVEQFLDRTEGKVPTQAALDVSGSLKVEYVNDWRGPESS